MSSLLYDSLWCSAYGIVGLFVILGNCLSIYLFVSNVRLRRMRTSSLLLNLSIADLIVGLVTLPMYMAVVWPGTNYALLIHIPFYATFVSIDVLTGFGSVFGLTVIALERVYSVFYPHHHRRASKMIYNAMIAVPWGLAVVLAILRALYENRVISLDGFFICVMTSLTVSLLTICIAYAAVWIKMNFKQSRIVNRTTLDRKSENKLAVTLGIITVLFILTWMPFHVLNIVMFLCVNCRTAIPYTYLNFFKLLHYSNSFINPIVYSSRFPEFQRTIKAMLCCRSAGVEPTNVEPSQLTIQPPVRDQLSVITVSRSSRYE